MIYYQIKRHNQNKKYFWDYFYLIFYIIDHLIVLLCCIGTHQGNVTTTYLYRNLCIYVIKVILYINNRNFLRYLTIKIDGN